MAFVEHIIFNETNTDLKLQLKQRNGTRYIEANNMAAITIQRHYRGYYSRVYISKLHLAATIIQKHWRGYTARK